MSTKGSVEARWTTTGRRGLRPHATELDVVDAHPHPTVVVGGDGDRRRREVLSDVLDRVLHGRGDGPVHELSSPGIAQNSMCSVILIMSLSPTSWP